MSLAEFKIIDFIFIYLSSSYVCFLLKSNTINVLVYFKLHFKQHDPLSNRVMFSYELSFINHVYLMSMRLFKQFNIYGEGKREFFFTFFCEKCISATFS